MQRLVGAVMEAVKAKKLEEKLDIADAVKTVVFRRRFMYKRTDNYSGLLWPAFSLFVAVQSMGRPIGIPLRTVESAKD